MLGIYEQSSNRNGIWGAWQIPLAHPILVACPFNSVIVTHNMNHFESTERSQ